jgi:hypothetical protein
MLRTFLRGHEYDDRTLEAMADRTTGASGSDLELIATNAARAAALSLSPTVTRRALEDALEDYRERLRGTDLDGDAPGG